jgi:hypothetical protein
MKRQYIIGAWHSVYRRHIIEAESLEQAERMLLKGEAPGEDVENLEDTDTEGHAGNNKNLTDEDLEYLAIDRQTHRALHELYNKFN